MPHSLGLSQEATSIVQDLFNAHTLGGEQARLMDQAGFKVAMCHALALSLTAPSRRSELALHTKYGKITRKINLNARQADAELPLTS